MSTAAKTITAATKTTSTAASWAADVAATVQAADRLARERREAAHTEAERLTGAVRTGGEAWTARLTTAMVSAIDAFNAAVGSVVVKRMPQAGDGLVLSRVPRGGSFAVRPINLAADPHGYAPGVTLAIEDARLVRNVTPFDFELDGDQLMLRVAGELLNPEQAAEKLLRPWLQSLTLDAERNGE